MTFTIITSYQGSQDSFSATAELTATVEDYKKEYEAQMTLAALVSNDSWTNKTGFYFADQSRDDLRENSIIPTAENLLEGQSPVHKLQIGDNDPIIIGETEDRSVPSAFSEIRLASPSEEKLTISVGVGNRRETQ